MFSGAAETANTAFAVAEFLDDVKAHLQHRHDNQLRQAFHGIERESALAPVPGRYHQLALGGAVLGWLLGHGGVGLLGVLMEGQQNLALSAWSIDPQEAWLLPAALLVGLAASIVPAVRAYRTDIAATLAHA